VGIESEFGATALEIAFAPDDPARSVGIEEDMDAAETPDDEGCPGNADAEDAAETPPMQLNPGAHRIKASRGSKELQWDVTATESNKTTTELDLAPLTRVDPAVAPSVAPSPMPMNAPSSQPADSAGVPSNPTRIAGWVFLGLGGVATAVGAATGIVTASKKSDLDDSGACANDLCYPEQRDLRESYNSMRIVSGASFVVGALALGTGATLLLTAPKPRQSGVEAHAQLGIGTFNVVGAF